MITFLSVELAIRSMLRNRVSVPRRYTSGIFTGVTLLSLLILWLVAFVKPAGDICSGSLIGWTPAFAKGGIALGIIMILAQLSTIVLLLLKVIRSVEETLQKRFAASRMVFHMITNALIMVKHHGCPLANPALTLCRFFYCHTGSM